MPLAPWVDQNLSADLINLRARGEGQTLEYISEFPKQTHELAKEIAAFATSNTGVILLGVGDDGDLVGLKDVTDPLQRDALLRRLEGICNNAIKPAVTPTVAWAVEEEQTVLVITVPKGSEPVYYSNDKPYLRHVSSSRPAHPHEVVGLVRQHLQGQPEPVGPISTEKTAFYSELAAILAGVLMWSELDANEKYVNPWLREWMAEFGYLGQQLRDLAASDVALELGLVSPFRELAGALEDIANFRPTIGSGNELRKLNAQIKDSAYGLKAQTVDALPVSDASIKQATQLITKNARKLADLATRAEAEIFSGAVEQVQAECGEMGRQLMRLSFYDLDALGNGAVERLRNIGAELRLIEVARMYIDGGNSLRAVVARIRDSQQRLADLAASLSV